MTARPYFLNDLGISCALGQGRQVVRAALLAGDQSGIQPDPGYLQRGETVVGIVPGLNENLPPLPRSKQFLTRSNRILYSALMQIEGSIARAVDFYGPERMGVVIGATTSGIEEGRLALARAHADGAFGSDFRLEMQELGNPSDFVSSLYQLQGPSFTISNACSSGANALAGGARLLATGQCDAVIVGGVDALTSLTLNGFDALSSIAPRLSNPFSANRSGINIGEGAAVFLMTRQHSDVALLGWGETSDGYHMNAPDPSGQGAIDAMQKAMSMAGCEAADIAYANLHGTGTRANDAMESLAVAQVLGHDVPVSSTKPMTGHTLGAAGAIEAGFLWLLLSRALSDTELPPHLWDGQLGMDCEPLNFVKQGETGRTKRRGSAMISNSFAFGGNNCSLVLGRSEQP
ncbi:beta-ketoacyl-ACP synthase [Ruegeria sp.]|uniref:beta-ketoacyl-ACP synthase n=1 Tax=Ruegeria sp. TaxID=1879320 RepID=UPI003B5C98AA